MLSEKLVGELKSKTKLVKDQINSITELEGWEIIQDTELFDRKKGIREVSFRRGLLPIDRVT